MKMLFFDYRKSEKEFFKIHSFSDFEITFYEGNLTEETELSDEEINDTQILSVFVTSQITKNVIDKFKNLRFIATRSSGYNHIDIKSCEDRNIAVVNVSGYGKDAVAQYTMGAVITLIRKVFPAMRDLKNDNINMNKYTGFDLKDLSIGVIGTGYVGTSVCRMANFFGMHVFAHDIIINPEIKDIVDYISLDDIYKHSNIITLHIPYTNEVYHMLSDEEFEMMNDGTFLVNASRGELVDNIALYNAIKRGKISGVALDVLECEYLNMFSNNGINYLKNIPDNCLENAIITKKLLAEDNVIITPHIAYNTQKSINTILNITFANIKSCITGKCLNRIV